MQLPVRFQVLPESIVTTALSETAVPPSALSIMLIVPLKVLLSDNVISSVEIVSTTISPSKVWSLAENVTCAPFAPAVPQPWEAELPQIFIR